MMAKKLTALAGLLALASVACGGPDFTTETDPTVPNTTSSTGGTTGTSTTGTTGMTGFTCKGTLDPAYIDAEPVTTWSWTLDTAMNQACGTIDDKSACVACTLDMALDKPQCTVTVTGPDKLPMTVSFDPANGFVYIKGGTDFVKSWTPACK